MIITIDGPTASGKSTIGRKLAQRLGYYYLYSGILYRALGYVLVHEYGYTNSTLVAVKHIDIDAVLNTQRFKYSYSKETQERIVFDGIDITKKLKTPEVDLVSSVISTIPYVRDVITQLQRDIATSHNTVADGRDTGSVVFPDAQHKFFLTASLAVRARRWAGQQAKQGNVFSQAQAEDIINTRDQRDITRKSAPLIIPEGAVVIDSSGVSVEQTLDLMLDHINKK